MQKVRSRSFLVACCYCSTRRPRESMTIVPPIGNEKREKWIDILGDEFEENIQIFAQPHICLSHFKYLPNGKRKKSSLPIPLPFCSEKDGLPVEFEDIPDDSVVPEKKPKNDSEVSNNSDEIKSTIFICCFCGEEVGKSESTQIPRTDLCRRRWAHVFGSEFLVNSFETGNSRVCTFHLYEKPQFSQLSLQLRSRVEYRQLSQIPETPTPKNIVKKICAYCGLPRNILEMKIVPYNCQAWENELGSVFRNFIRLSREPCYICLAHFDYLNEVPKRLPFFNAEAGLNILNDQYYFENSEYLGPNNTPINESASPIDFYDPKIVIDAAIVELYRYLSSEKEFAKQSKRHSKYLDQSKINQMPDLICCYSVCGKRRPIDEMVRLPYCSNAISEWNHELGNEIDISNQLNFICISHFYLQKGSGQIMPFTLPIPLPFDSLKYNYPDDVINVKISHIPPGKCNHCDEQKNTDNLSSPSSNIDTINSDNQFDPIFLNSQLSQLDHFQLQNDNIPDNSEQVNHQTLKIPNFNNNFL